MWCVYVCLCERKTERERGKVTLLNVTAFIKTHYFNCNYNYPFYNFTILKKIAFQCRPWPPHLKGRLHKEGHKGQTQFFYVYFRKGESHHKNMCWLSFRLQKRFIHWWRWWVCCVPHPASATQITLYHNTNLTQNMHDKTVCVFTIAFVEVWNLSTTNQFKRFYKTVIKLL